MKKKKFIVQDGKLYETEILQDNQIKRWTSEKIRGIKLAVKDYCNPKYKRRCGFRRGKDRRCFWEGTCNQKMASSQKIKSYEPRKPALFLLILN